MFPDEYNPYYQGVEVEALSDEKTPDMHKPPDPEVPTPGIYRNCYLCGIDIARLHATQVAIMEYKQELTKQEKWDGCRQIKYVITYCIGCYKTHITNNK